MNGQNEVRTNRPNAAKAEPMTEYAPETDSTISSLNGLPSNS